jgi:hypothetical protein
MLIPGKLYKTTRSQWLHKPCSGSDIKRLKVLDLISLDPGVVLLYVGITDTYIGKTPGAWRGKYTPATYELKFYTFVLPSGKIEGVWEETEPRGFKLEKDKS